MRVCLLLAGLVEELDTLVLVLLSDVADSVRNLVFGLVFLVGWDFALAIRFEPASKSGLGKNGKEMFPLKDRVMDELDFGIAMSDFLMIFPSDSSTVVFDEFIFF